jgi:hypothetical protein
MLASATAVFALPVGFSVVWNFGCCSACFHPGQAWTIKLAVLVWYWMAGRGFARGSRWNLSASVPKLVM